jgi:hypothetical protein
MALLHQIRLLRIPKRLSPLMALKAPLVESRMTLLLLRIPVHPPTPRPLPATLTRLLVTLPLRIPAHLLIPLHLLIPAQPLTPVRQLIPVHRVILLAPRTPLRLPLIQARHPATQVHPQIPALDPRMHHHVLHLVNPLLPRMTQVHRQVIPLERLILSPLLPILHRRRAVILSRRLPIPTLQRIRAVLPTPPTHLVIPVLPLTLPRHRIPTLPLTQMRPLRMILHPQVTLSHRATILLSHQATLPILMHPRTEVLTASLRIPAQQPTRQRHRHRATQVRLLPILRRRLQMTRTHPPRMILMHLPRILTRHQRPILARLLTQAARLRLPARIRQRLRTLLHLQVIQRPHLATPATRVPLPRTILLSLTTRTHRRIPLHPLIQVSQLQVGTQPQLRRTVPALPQTQRARLLPVVTQPQRILTQHRRARQRILLSLQIHLRRLRQAILARQHQRILRHQLTRMHHLQIQVQTLVARLQMVQRQHQHRVSRLIPLLLVILLQHRLSLRIPTRRRLLHQLQLPVVAQMERLTTILTANQHRKRLSRRMVRPLQLPTILRVRVQALLHPRALLVKMRRRLVGIIDRVGIVESTSRDLLSMHLRTLCIRGMSASRWHDSFHSMSSLRFRL